ALLWSTAGSACGSAASGPGNLAGDLDRPAVAVLAVGEPTSLGAPLDLLDPMLQGDQSFLLKPEFLDVLLHHGLPKSGGRTARSPPSIRSDGGGRSISRG